MKSNTMRCKHYEYAGVVRGCEEDEAIEDNLAQRVCEVVKRNEALAEEVRIVKPNAAVRPVDESKSYSGYILLQECNCAAVRIK